jgi:hypothetical protein
MKCFDWSEEKNEELKCDRDISFEEIVFAIMHGGLLAILEHPNPVKCSNQKGFIVDVDDYAHIVPFVETDEGVFLKTIIPSRKMTKKYLGGKNR